MITMYVHDKSTGEVTAGPDHDQEPQSFSGAISPSGSEFDRPYMTCAVGTLDADSTVADAICMVRNALVQQFAAIAERLHLRATVAAVDETLWAKLAEPIGKTRSVSGYEMLLRSNPQLDKIVLIKTTPGTVLVYRERSVAT